MKVSASVRAPPSPNPAELVAWRERADLSQPEAAALIYCGYRAWQEWEGGRTRMHPQLWEAFKLKAGKLIERRRASP